MVNKPDWIQEVFPSSKGLEIIDGYNEDSNALAIVTSSVMQTFAFARWTQLSQSELVKAGEKTLQIINNLSSDQKINLIVDISNVHYGEMENAVKDLVQLINTIPTLKAILQHQQIVWYVLIRGNNKLNFVVSIAFNIALKAVRPKDSLRYFSVESADQLVNDPRLLSPENFNYPEEP